MQIVYSDYRDLNKRFLNTSAIFIVRPKYRNIFQGVKRYTQARHRRAFFNRCDKCRGGISKFKIIIVC